MIRLILSFIALLVSACASMTGAQRIDLPQYLAMSGPAPDTVLHYGSAPSQTVEFFRPRGRGPFPVVILIHGGCWLSRYAGLAQMRGMASALAEQGIAVWSVEYRRIDEVGGGYPGTYQDIAAALDMLNAQGPQLGLDLHRTIAVGHSAGADLALWAAARAKIPRTSPLFAQAPMRIRTVISLGGLPDLRADAAAIHRSCGIDVDALTGASSVARPDPLIDTSPASMLPDGVNTVGINGADDTVAPPEIAAAYAALARKTGDPASTIVVEGAGHLDEVTTTSSVWPVLQTAIHEALPNRNE